MSRLGLRIAIKEPDEEHSYGHGKAELLAAVAVSIFNFGIYMDSLSFCKFYNTPHALPKNFMLWILLIVIGIKETMFRYVFKVGKKINGQAVKADAHNHRSDAITFVAAFIGISIALIAGKGDEGADDWEALVALALIFYNAIVILRPALSEGRILLDGHDLHEYDLVELRMQVDVIFQDYLRYQMTVSQNVAVGNIAEKENRNLIINSAKQSLADAWCKSYPTNTTRL